MTELLARLRAVLRRIRPSLAEDVVSVGDIEMDRAAHRVRRAGNGVHLGPTEYRLLDHLIQHPGRVFRREQLLDAVWGSDVYVEARTVDVHVGRLRKALNIEGAADPIRTVRSAGYSLDSANVAYDGGLKQLTNRCFKLIRRCLGCKSRHWVAGAVDQELGKIPFDRFNAQNARLGLGEILKQRMRISTIDVDLGEHRESNAIIFLAEGPNLRVATRLLAAELIAGKAQDSEPLGSSLRYSVSSPAYCGVKPH